MRLPAPSAAFPRQLPVALLVAAAAAAAAPAAALATEPIEGTWTYGDGRVLVERVGPAEYVGTVVKRVRFTNCDHPVGEKMWSLGGSGSSYRGTHVWYGASPKCDIDPGGRSTWRITDQDPKTFALRFCTAPPGQGAPQTRPDGTAIEPTYCMTLRRTKPPAPSEVECSGGACVVATSPPPRSPQGGSQDAPPSGGDGSTGTEPPAKCAPAGRVVRHLSFRLRGSNARRYRVKSVAFSFDGRLFAVRRKAPFRARFSRRIGPGRHVIEAQATIANRRSGRKSRRSVRYAFRVCG
jgi:hypothetical protein